MIEILVILILFFGGAVFIAIGQDSWASIWWTVIGIVGIVAGLVMLFVTMNANTKDAEQRCLARGGEVVHYGRYGAGVDCINVPEGR